MLLEQGQKIAVAIIEKLAPYCERDERGKVLIEVAGSIRRQKPLVNDIDIVLIPSDPWNLNHTIGSLGHAFVHGAKIQRFYYQGAQVDLYFATRETWATLFLIRTGSKWNNIRLCEVAQKKGWRLAADGSGLLDERDRRVAGDTEESIYEALGEPYQQPEKRG